MNQRLYWLFSYHNSIKYITLAIFPNAGRGSMAVDEVVPTCIYKCVAYAINARNLISTNDGLLSYLTSRLDTFHSSSTRNINSTLVPISGDKH